MRNINSKNDLRQDTRTQPVENWLKNPEIHQNWISSYHSGDRTTFYDNALDYIIRVIGIPSNALILDVGCGSGDLSIRLAKKGFLIKGIDLSESVLEIAEKNIKSEGMSSKITLHCENIRELSFKNQQFTYIFCWGVLMHIPDLEKAISELSRVLKPGGFLIISEINSNAIEIQIKRMMQYILKRPINSKITSFGIEDWGVGSDTTSFCRYMNISWFVNRLNKEKIFLVNRVAGEFTESYSYTSSILIKKIIYSFNNFWFKYVKLPQPAAGNIIIFKKENI